MRNIYFNYYTGVQHETYRMQQFNTTRDRYVIAQRNISIDSPSAMNDPQGW